MGYELIEVTNKLFIFARKRGYSYASPGQMGIG
jgi:hypothetical protein